MSCSKQHGPQAFIGFVADSTGETISQQDWHDLRSMAEELGGDMGREQVSPQEAIASLKALDAKLKADASAEKRKKDATKVGIPAIDDQFDEMRARSAESSARNKIETDKIRQRIFDAFQIPLTPEGESKVKKPSTSAPKTPTPPPVASPVDTAAKELLSAKVTRGTLTVMRMFVEVGVKPLLALVRARREQQKRIKKTAKEFSKIRREAYKEYHGHVW